MYRKIKKYSNTVIYDISTKLTIQRHYQRIACRDGHMKVARRACGNFTTGRGNATWTGGNCTSCGGNFTWDYGNLTYYGGNFTLGGGYFTGHYGNITQGCGMFT
jgi:hypothetical protein